MKRTRKPVLTVLHSTTEYGPVVRITTPDHAAAIWIGSPRAFELVCEVISDIYTPEAS